MNITVRAVLDFGDRINHYNRWKSYVKNNPDKYRIRHLSTSAIHKTFLQERYKGRWMNIEKLPNWKFYSDSNNFITQDI